MSIRTLLLILAGCAVLACGVDRGPLKSSGAAGVNADAGGFGGSGATSGAGAFGGSAGTGGVGAVGGTGGVGAVGGTGGVGAVGGTGGVGGFSGGDAGMLSYEPGAVGAPCSVDTQCEAGRMSRTCFTEGYFAPLLTLPGGYCATLCELSGACEPGSVCITIPTFPPVPVCMRSCGIDSNCRMAEGYTCNKPFTSASSVCSLRVN